MKSLIIPIIVFIGLLFSCAPSTKYSDAVEKNSSTAVAECYAYTKNGDSVVLHLTIEGHEITGNLTYNLKERDSNRGTFTGNIIGDTLIADYTFRSEGMQSTRQIAFIRNGQSLIEGSGEIQMQGDKAVFKNPKTLDYKNGIVLTKNNCK